MSNTQEQDIAMLKNLLGGYNGEADKALKSAIAAMENQGKMIEVVRKIVIDVTMDGTFNYEDEQKVADYIRHEILTKLTKIDNTP